MRMLMMLLLVSTFVSGVEITEVMFDPEGPDSGREWIEIYNRGKEVNLSDLKFYEAGVFHNTVIWQGQEIMSNGSLAIIADEADKFMGDYPGYNGILLDSSWGSLSNNGEEIGISISGELVDRIQYDSSWKQPPTPGYLEIDSVPEFTLAGILAILTFAFLAYRR